MTPGTWRLPIERRTWYLIIGVMKMIEFVKFQRNCPPVLKDFHGILKVKVIHNLE